MSIEWILLYLLLGSFVGFIAGLLGAGGGGILVPLLATIFTYQGVAGEHVIHLALGTSLACMIISSTASMRAHASLGSVVWKIVYGMAPGIVLGTMLITRIAADASPIYIAIFFAAFMALVALQMFLNWKPKTSQTPTTLRGLFFVGGAVGSISALAAVGGGFLTVTYLSYKNIEMKKAIGTSSAIAFPIAIAGTLGYMINGWSKMQSEPYTLGFIYVPAFFIISVASVIAAPYGARCAHGLPERKLKKIFAGISLLLSLKMLGSII